MVFVCFFGAAARNGRDVMCRIYYAPLGLGCGVDIGLFTKACSLGYLYRTFGACTRMTIPDR